MGAFGGKPVEVGVNSGNKLFVRDDFGVVGDHHGAKRGNDVFHAGNARRGNARGDGSYKRACFWRYGLGDDDINSGISAY